MFMPIRWTMKTIRIDCASKLSGTDLFTFYLIFFTKVKATIPLTRRTRAKGLQSRRGQFIHKFL